MPLRDEIYDANSQTFRNPFRYALLMFCGRQRPRLQGSRAAKPLWRL